MYGWVMFAVRSIQQVDGNDTHGPLNLSSSNPAATDQQDMSLRTLAWLASAPLLLTTTSLCNVVEWQGQGEDLQPEQGQGRESQRPGREVRLVENSWTGQQGPSLYGTTMQRISRSGTAGPRIPDRVQQPWDMDGLCPMQDAPVLHPQFWGACFDEKGRGAASGHPPTGGELGQRGALQPEASGQGHRPGQRREELYGKAGEDQGAEGSLQQGEGQGHSFDGWIPVNSSASADSEGQSPVRTNDDQLGGGRPEHVTRTKRSSCHHCRGVGGRAKRGRSNLTGIVHGDFSMTADDQSTKYELIPEDETVPDFDNSDEDMPAEN